MFYGLSNPVVFTGGTGITPLSGHVNLVSVVNAPAGLLLRRVSSITEALGCGGVMLYEHSTGKSLCYFGVTAYNAVSKNKFGKIYQYTSANQFSYTARSDGHWPTRTGRYHDLPTPTSYERTKSAGLMIQHGTPVLTDYFATVGTEIVILGILCGADEGMIQSHPTDGAFPWIIRGHSGLAMRADPKVALGYCASRVRINAPFSDYFFKNKSTAMSLIPSDLQKYYESSYSAAMSGFAYKDVLPTIGVATFWEDRVLSPGRMQASTVVPYEVVSHLNSYACAVNAPPEVRAACSAVITADPTFNSGANVMYTLPSENGKLSVYIPGGRYINDPDIPYLDSCSHLFGGTEYALATGEMSGLKAGVLRDGHLLGRSLVDGLRYSDEASQYPAIGPFVAACIPVDSTATSAAFGAVIDEETAREYNLQVETQPAVPESPSIYSRGTLGPLLEMFSSEWDVQAELAAKA